eukprot:TRINITY_DN21221_c0_g1_i1.p1 TRINITY_DN21221_c0_g1~~TRINITY_DN21221_c0_g1_i1.p1  ORF type:complete len:104 (-),score=8.73 TRINITY_DN21221_c0_g1_i1:127-438(-)
MSKELYFRSGQKQLVAIEHLPVPVANESAAKQGVVIVVGGPQTRVGSHRLFVSLARELSKQGIAVFVLTTRVPEAVKANLLNLPLYKQILTQQLIVLSSVTPS